MKKYLLSIIYLLFSILTFSQNQKIQLKYGGKEGFVSVEDKGYSGFDITLNIQQVQTESILVNEKRFIQLEVDGLSKIFESGIPNIPIYSKLIELPIGASVKVEIVSFDEEYIDFAEYGIYDKIIPAQPSQSRSNDKQDFYFNEEIYKLDSYLEQSMCKIEEIGMLRGNRLGRLIILPIQYNPSKNMLKIFNNIHITVSFENVDVNKTELIKKKYSCCDIDNIVREYTLNSILKTTYYTKNASPTYVIISDRMFENQISNFAATKTSMGLNVLVKYTDDPSVGTTTTSIKNYLSSIYNNPPTGYDIPKFVLLVGDVAQIPTFYKSNPPDCSYSQRPTDLYYFDYTNDHLPDVFYGRFSANNVAQLTPQVMKTIYYESNVVPETSYLFNAVLVAGADAVHATQEGNGTLNYAVNQYFNAAHGITAHAYYQPEPSGGNYSSNIKSNINSGAGFVYYTGHCTPNGWANPSFSNSDISLLTNVNKYGLWVGNCCLSNKFDESECFGEAAVRAYEMGTMGYIGATSETYWHEDFFWSVGFKTISSNPSFDANHLGAFDRYFQMDNLPYFLQGQFILAGNLAVEESTSSNKQYYWEIYQLLGDPSVKINIYCGTTTISDTITTFRWFRDCKINVQNTIIDNNATVIIEALQHTTFNAPFEIKSGSTMHVK